MKNDRSTSVASRDRAIRLCSTHIYKKSRRLWFETLEARLVYAANPFAGYKTYQEVVSQLQSIANNPAYTSMAKLELLPQKSTLNRDLWVMRISDNVQSDEPDEPSVFYTGSLHGDEPDGAELSLYLINELLANPTNDATIKKLVENTEIYIMPVLNPDGYEARTRFNSNGVDLNRSFPDYFDDVAQSKNQLSVALNTATVPAEAAAIMSFSYAKNFVLAADFHENGGVAVVNYPYDSAIGIASGTYARSPDDDLFKYISKVYSSRDSQMWDASSKGGQYGVAYVDPVTRKKVSALTVNTTFPTGSVNGSDWFSIRGSLQDWHYRYMGTNAVTVEVRDKPNFATSDELWKANKDAMLAYMKSAHSGVRGNIVDELGNTVRASIIVEGIGTNPAVNIGQHFVFSNASDGTFFRMLPPATYSNLKITISAETYEPLMVTRNISIPNTITNTVPPPTNTPTPTLIDLGTFVLTKLANPASLAMDQSRQSSAAPMVASTSNPANAKSLQSRAVASQPSSSQLDSANILRTPLGSIPLTYAQRVDSVFAVSNTYSLVSQVSHPLRRSLAAKINKPLKPHA